VEEVGGMVPYLDMAGWTRAVAGEEGGSSTTERVNFDVTPRSGLTYGRLTSDV
jgi:hypothetical protein